MKAAQQTPPFLLKQKLNIMKKSKFLSNVSHEETASETQEKSGFDWWGLADGLMGLTGKFIDTRTEAEKTKQAASAAAQAQAAAEAAKAGSQKSMTPWLIGGGVAVVLVVILIVVLKK